MLIYGAGEHAQVVWEALESKKIEVKGIFDDNPEKRYFRGLIVQRFHQRDDWPFEEVIIAVGNNVSRSKIAHKIIHNFGIVLHSHAWVSPSAKLREGTIVMANAAVQAYAQVGKHNIINTGAIIEHDTKLGDFVHIAPGAALGGCVEVGDFTLVGMNATVLPGTRIGKHCVVAAGAVVNKDVPDDTIALGNPARFKKIKS